MVSKRGKETVEVLAPNQSRKEKNDTFGKWARNGEELSLNQESAGGEICIDGPLKALTNNYLPQTNGSD